MGIVIGDRDGWVYRYLIEENDRFVLGVIGKRPLICFGINPSTAKPEKLDRTLSRVRNESIERGFDGWIMLNLYPQRATKPRNLHNGFEQGKKIFGHNLDQIKAIFDAHKKEITVWAAWGSVIEKRPYLKECLKEILEVLPFSVKWKSMGKLTKKGHPHHPLYLKKGLDFKDFDVRKYLKDLK